MGRGADQECRQGRQATAREDVAEAVIAEQSCDGEDQRWPPAQAVRWLRQVSSFLIVIRFVEGCMCRGPPSHCICQDLNPRCESSMSLSERWSCLCRCTVSTIHFS